MHIPDGFLAPGVCVGAGALAAAGCGWSLYRLRDSLADRTVPLTGMTSALIFAGQMINFPLPGLPVSGHLLGGVLAGALLGPYAGCIALMVVLFVQLALFYDGGWTVFGANVLNMAVLGAMGGTLVYRQFRRLFGESRRGVMVSVMLAAWLSVVAAAGLFSIEFLLSFPDRREQLAGVFFWMLAYHLIIGLGEALITASVVGFVLQQRPDLLDLPAEKPNLLRTAWRFSVLGVVFALAVAACLSPFASEYDDGLEAVSQKVGFAELTQPRPFLLWDDYRVPALAESNPAASTGTAGVIGTAAVLVVAGAVVWMFSRRRQTTSPEPPPQNLTPSSTGN